MEYVIFGESHGPAIGVTLTGLPSGLSLDMEAIQAELDRRAPGRSDLSTTRKEADVPEIISGVFEGKLTGTPLTAIFRNEDTHSEDYAALRYRPRPGHADYSGFHRYDGANDPRGGGHFSGRLTAPLVFAGAVAKQVLKLRGVEVVSHISSIYGISDDVTEHMPDLKALRGSAFPVLNPEKGEEMRQAILAAKEAGDSVGGSIECAVLGLGAGYGAPDLGQNVEGIFSKHLFAVPAVKAIGFGAGVAFGYMLGSEANDPFEVSQARVHTKTNHAGGINGGITNGEDVVFEVTLRPTPSIALPQESVDLTNGTNIELTITGRHDPCVVPRAVPAIEAAAALATMEVLGL